MRRIVLAAISLTALAPLPVAAQMLQLTPTQIGEIFCLSRMGNDMGPVEGLTSPTLAATIDYAEALNADLQRRMRDEKGPLGDGVPWQSYPDYAPNCVAGEVENSATASSIALTYSFPDDPDAGWTDRLVVVPVELFPGAAPVRRIDNIVYDDGSDLRSALLSAVDLAK